MKTIRALSAAARGALLAFGFAGSLAAADPFSVTVSSHGMHGPDSLTVGSSSFLDLIDDLVNARAEFTVFDGMEYNATLDYLGVGDAMNFFLNGSGTEAFLEIPSLGFSESFFGGSREEVYDQIEDWFKKDGADVYADFLKSIAKESAASVTDGNPTAATAAAAQSSFETLGWTPIEDLLTEPGAASPNYSGFGLGFNSGRFKAGNLRGSKSDLALPFKFRLSDRLSLAGSIPVQWIDLEGAKVYGVGAHLALPYRMRMMSKEEPMNWRLTPMIGMTLRASGDLASGAALFQYGLINSIDYRINSKWIICIVNQLSGYQSLTVTYDDYEFDPDITQIILKNGVRGVTKVSDRWILDAYLVDTRFLESAAVKQFWTIGGSAMFKLTKTRNLQFGANYDTGDDFSAWSVGLSTAWRF
jgi:hypothetical protein